MTRLAFIKHAAAAAVFVAFAITPMAVAAPVTIVAGVVTDADGNGIDGVLVIAQGTAGIQTDTTEGGGGFFMSNFGMGSLTVTARLDGYVAPPQSINIKSGTTTNVDFTLVPGVDPNASCGKCGLD